MTRYRISDSVRRRNMGRTEGVLIDVRSIKEVLLFIREFKYWEGYPIVDEIEVHEEEKQYVPYMF